MSDKDTTLQDLKDAFEQFKADRQWHKYHSPKNLAASIAIEAAELLEHYQWQDDDDDKDEVASELADVIMYCLSFASETQIDISEAVKTKLDEISKRFPAETFGKESDLQEYYKIKKQRRGKAA